MEKTTITDTQKILEVSMSILNDSKFEKAMLERLYFNDVNMSGTKITNANLSDLEIEGAQMGGAWIHNIGMPPEGHPFYNPAVQQRPVRFDDCNFSNSTIHNCNLSSVAITDCETIGMTINGILVDDLLKQYRHDNS